MKSYGGAVLEEEKKCGDAVDDGVWESLRGSSSPVYQGASPGNHDNARCGVTEPAMTSSAEGGRGAAQPIVTCHSPSAHTRSQRLTTTPNTDGGRK